MADRLPGDCMPAQGGFDVTLHMRRLCADMCARLDELSHVDVSRVAIRFCQARKSVVHGLLATLTPLRFENGERSTRRGDGTWTIGRIDDTAQRDVLYLLSFYMPRFLNLPLEEKLATVVHELWHVSPRFDGDLRRHPGRCYAHSHSRKQYDVHAQAVAQKWLSLDPPSATYEALRLDFHELTRRYGRVFGQKIRTPKLFRAS